MPQASPPFARTRGSGEEQGERKEKDDVAFESRRNGPCENGGKRAKLLGQLKRSNRKD